MTAIKWIKTNELSDNAQTMLSAFESSFSRNSTSYLVTYHDRDQIFVSIYGILCAYQLMHFLKTNSEIYIEIDARARNYIELRMFCSEWLREHELPRMHAIADAPARKNELSRSIRVKRGSYEHEK